MLSVHCCTVSLSRIFLGYCMSLIGRQQEMSGKRDGEWHTTKVSGRTQMTSETHICAKYSRSAYFPELLTVSKAVGQIRLCWQYLSPVSNQQHGYNAWQQAGCFLLVNGPVFWHFPHPVVFILWGAVVPVSHVCQYEVNCMICQCGPGQIQFFIKTFFEK